ncbi:heparinase II/III family protein [Rhizobium sp. TH2]|uniref:heparinase II/III family protein n=1 Tax=Rhizobium sp. TH2 TaxID=2775403 RepID=UPI0021577259|nr:heparinase II/III family protein [Rhizobium sp. TH2]UVC08441.1 heparinase II/III family protein [Rhizobium sp. TH2]
MSVSGRRRYLSHYMGETRRRFSRGFAAFRVTMMPALRRTPKSLVVAPTDLRAADPFIAEEIAEGRFPLAGRALDTHGYSPFSIELPSKEFASRLHSFSWLRHIRATKSDTHYATARQLTDEWIALHGKRITGLAWDADVTAQRIVAWLSHSTVVLKNADVNFYRRFLRSLAMQIRYLELTARNTPDGEIRLRIRIALAVATVSLPASAGRLKRASRDLDRELERQILGDGGHISRNPRTGLELLFDLLPLRQTYVNLGHDLPARLMPAIDRMYPALRFFRHQGGELALFNGATTTLAHELMSVLRYDETAGKPFRALPHMHYQRLAAGDTVIIVDTGVPISTSMSRTAHAGCLSFEMSSGKHRFVINSGAPRFAGETYRQLARATAAHSTVTVNDTSSSRISKSGMAGPVFSDGVTRIKLERQEIGDDGGDGLIVSHDGYAEPFGLIHERTLQINAAGSQIRGNDRLALEDGSDPPVSTETRAVARFHIHPQIEIREVDEHEVRLVAPDGETWALSTLDAAIRVEEDVFFADPSGIRASQQLELNFEPGESLEIQWVLSRIASAGSN